MNISRSDQFTLLYDPFVHSKQGAEDSLKANVSRYYPGYIRENTDHIFQVLYQNEILSYNTKTKDIYWAPFHDTSTFANDLIDNSSWDGREDNIRKRLGYCENSRFKNVLMDSNSSVFYKIPEGRNTIECSVYEDFPFIFTSSYSYYNMNHYFDMIVIPENPDKKDRPICYSHQALRNFPFEHSGDDYSSNCLLQSINVKKNWNIKTNKCYHSGYICFQAYNKKSFFTIRKCEPNICFVDKKPDVCNIWVLHFPLIKNFVGDSCLAYIAKFEYFPENQKIVWSFLKNPHLSNQKFNVGNCMKDYMPSLREFEAKLRSFSSNNKTLEANILSEPSSTAEAELSESSLSIPFNDETTVLIIQEPLLEYEDNVVEFLINEFSEEAPGENFKKYTFHQNIKTYDNRKAVNDLKYYYSLPIGGGSVISEHPFIKLSKPIENSTTAANFVRDIRYSRKTIMIVSENYISSNNPIVFTKLNACYIVINHSHQIFDIDNALNNTNTSMALMQQGTLSTIIVYFPCLHKFFFVRGVGTGYQKFGDEVTVIDILSFSSITSRVLIQPAFPKVTNICPVYDIRGREIFQLRDGECQDAKYIYTCIQNTLKPNDNENDFELTIRCILAQLEVIIDANVLVEIKILFLQRIRDIATLSKRNAIQIIQSDCKLLQWKHKFNFKRFEKLLDVEGQYSKKWLVKCLRTLYTNMKDGDVVAFYTDIKKVIESYNAINNDKYEMIYRILQNCISTTSSYGKREKDVNKLIKQTQIESNVTAIKNLDNNDFDDLITRECDQGGALIYSIHSKSLYLQTTCPSSSSSSLILTMDDRFYQISSEYAVAFLEYENSINDEKEKVLTFHNKEENSVMIIIPILDRICNVMRDGILIRTYPWNQPEIGSSVDFTRIMLRETVCHLMKPLFPNIEASSQHVGKMVIHILLSAAHCLLEKFKKGDDGHISISVTEVDTNHFIVKNMRGIIGLLISVMASGLDVPLNSCYQALLYSFTYSSLPPRMKFTEEDILILEDLITFWPWLKLENEYRDVRLNILECVEKKLHSIKEKIIREEKSKFKSKNAPPNPATLWQTQKAVWLFNRCRPLILHILKTANKGMNNTMISKILKVEPLLCKYKKPLIRFDQEAKMKILVEKEDWTVEPPKYDLEKMQAIEKEIICHIKELQKNSIDITDGLRDVVSSTLKVYKNLANVNTHFDDTSRLFKCVKKLEILLNDDNTCDQKLKAAWLNVVSMAFDKYLNKSNVIRLHVERIAKCINDIIFNINKNQYTSHDLSKANEYLSGELETDTEVPESFIQLRRARAALFHIFLNLMNPLELRRIPPVIRIFSECTSLAQYMFIYSTSKHSEKGEKLKEKYRGFLFNYIIGNEGHFGNLVAMKGTMSDDQKIIQELKDKFEATLYEAITKDKQIKNLYQFKEKLDKALGNSETINMVTYILSEQDFQL